MERGLFFRQFLALFSGTALAQLFNLASYPVLARLYTPADFGVLGTFIAAAAIPGALACARYELAITTAPHSGRKAVLWLCFLLAMIVASISTLIFTAYLWWADVPHMTLLAPLMFVAVALTGGVNALTMYLMRHEAFSFASSGAVLRTAATVLVQMILAALIEGAIGLVIGFCAGLVAQSLLGLIVATRNYNFGRPRQRGMKAMFTRFRPQVSVDIPGSLMAALSVNLLPFFLQALYGMKAVGHYSLGQRVAVMPLQLFNDSLAQVFFQRAARAQEQRGEFWAEFRFTLLAASAVGAVMLAGLLLFARPVVAIYLGPQWDVAGHILVILAPMLAVRGVTMSLATTVFVLKRPIWLLWHNVASVAAIGMAVVWAWASHADLLGFLTALSIAQGLEYAFFGIVLTRAAWRQKSKGI